MTALKSILSSWLCVDLRTLGIFRIALGFVVLVDILRRVPYIEIFYSINGVAPNYFMSELTGRYSSKAFSLLSSLNTTTEITIFFVIAAVFAFFLMIGYKTKISHIITVITVLSIHNRLIMLENGADLVINNILIWSAFLPLGGRFSFDRFLKSLRDIDDSSESSLNQDNLTIRDEPRVYWGLAYFASLLQLSIIYLFNFFNKSGNTWEQGISIYYFYNLDTFLTPIGNFVKEFGLMPLFLSKLLTSMTMYLELIIPILILFPFLTLWTRRFTLVTMIGFHIVIGISLYIGMFSWIMIATLLLLISPKDIKILKIWLSKLSSGPHIVFYDSDCGFCHQCARILRRMDLFGHLTWAGKNWSGEQPDQIDSLRDSSIVVWNKSSNMVYTRDKAFAKILGAIPFGFIDALILKIPGVSHLSGFIYDIISRNRTSISTFLGYSGCDIRSEDIKKQLGVSYQRPTSSRLLYIFTEGTKSIAVAVLIVAALQYAFTKNDGFKDWQKEMGYEQLPYNSNLNSISKTTRMIQRWNMFSPNTPRSFQWVIIEATLKDGTVIDLMTGKEPVYDKLGYDTYSQIDNSQFWRKYFSRIAKKSYKRYRPQLQKTLLSTKNPIKPYDDLNQDGVVDRSDKIESVAIYKLSKSIQSPLVEEGKVKKVRKSKISFVESGSSKKSKIIK